MSLLSYSAFHSKSSGKQRASGATSEPTDSTDFGTDIDAETSALIAKLALEDLEEVYGGRQSKSQVGGSLSDEEYAYQLQAAHYRELLTVVEDSKIARSLREAVETDSAYVEALRIAEEAALEDRQVALALSRGEPLPQKKACQIEVENPAFLMHPEPPVYVKPCLFLLSLLKTAHL